MQNKRNEKSKLWGVHAIVLTTAMWGLQGCVKVADNNPKAPAPSSPATNSPASPMLTVPEVPSAPLVPQPAIDPANFRQSLNMVLKPDASPEKYHVIFSWPHFTSKASVAIKFRDQNVVIPDQQYELDDLVDHNQNIDYAITIYGEDLDPLDHMTMTAHVPRDWVVRFGQSEIQSNYQEQLGRLYLNPDFPLTTNGFDLSLTVSQLISKKGSIQNFPVDAKAPADQDGAKGGDISIDADEAQGDLSVYMRGQKGGDGSQASGVPGTGAAGTPGGLGRTR